MRIIYDVLLDISKKCFDVDTEINDINTKLEVLKNTKSISEIINKIKELI